MVALTVALTVVLMEGLKVVQKVPEVVLRVQLAHTTQATT